MLGLSRLGYALAVNRQIPSRVRLAAPHAGDAGGDHRVRRGDRDRAAAPGRPGVPGRDLRVRRDDRVHDRRAVGDPAALEGADRDRPYKMPLNVRVRGGELPIPAVLCVGAVAASRSSRCWSSTAPRAGSASRWMVAGISLYLGYRLSQGKHVFKRVTVPEAALTRRAAEVEFGSILVPVLGTPLDDDIMQTAGPARRRGERDEDEGGAVIEAAVGVRGADDAAARRARARRGAQARPRGARSGRRRSGRSTRASRSQTAVVRARKAGQAIVTRPSAAASRRSCWPPRSRRASAAACGYGGKPGLHDTSVGETTRYVINKATCRVILTAPPAAADARPDGPGPDGRRRSRSGTSPIRRVPSRRRDR